MSTANTIVLKFGGSVLRDEHDLSSLVHEVYRHYRRGARVLVIVSAFAGTTDRLLAGAERVGDRRAEHAVAALLGTAEQTAAALAVLALERAGVPAALLEPHAIGLVATGPALDATPTDVDTGAIDAAFRAARVLVAPGFIARSATGAPVLMGRGGSDLTALFLAQRLGARTCRLVKDVEGLYERDPATPGPAPERFVTLHWDDARALGGTILQDKALAFARAEELPFEVGGLGAATTHVGDECSIRTASAGEPARPLRVAVLGLGHVGTGVYRELAARPERFEVIRVLVRDAHKPRAAQGVEALLTTDFADVLASRPAAVVELLGGTSPAREWIEQARAAGCAVVTANKAVLAEHPALLAEVACAASVGGALPALEYAGRLGRHGLTGLEGVINGTSNQVLERVATGVSLEEAVREAQAAGLAEADPTLDLDGTDVAHKLVLLARAAWPGGRIRWLEKSGLLGLDPLRVRDAARAGCRVRLVGACHRVGRDDSGTPALVASIALRTLPPSDPLARTRDEDNALRFFLADGREELLTGKGAGSWPTTTSVLADLFEIARAHERRHVRGLADGALIARDGKGCHVAS